MLAIFSHRLQQVDAELPLPPFLRQAPPCKEAIRLMVREGVCVTIFNNKDEYPETSLPVQQ